MNNNKIPTVQTLRLTLLGLACALFSILLSNTAAANDVILDFGPFGSSANGVIDGSGPFGTSVEDGAGGLVACPSDTDMLLEVQCPEF